jgi:hypothetical protein
MPAATFTRSGAFSQPNSSMKARLAQRASSAKSSPRSSCRAGCALKYWQTALREAEGQLDAARTRSELNAAAKKLQRAKAALKELEAETVGKPKRRSSRGRASGAASS